MMTESTVTESTPQACAEFDYLVACSNAAQERGRSVYVYWNPAGLVWESTIHPERVPAGAGYYLCTPDGKRYPVAAES